MQFKIKHREPPSIEIAPLIDVVFLLLLFFIVNAQFGSMPGLQVNLPEIKPGAPVSATARAEINLTAGGDIYVDGRPVALKDLEDALRKEIPEPDAVVVVLSADKNVPYGKVVSIMDVLRRLKLKKLVVSARWEESAPAR